MTDPRMVLPGDNVVVNEIGYIVATEQFICDLHRRDDIPRKAYAYAFRADLSYPGGLRVLYWNDKNIDENKITRHVQAHMNKEFLKNYAEA